MYKETFRVLVMPLDNSCQNLRGCSFKGQHLEGANFSGADIQGCDFTDAKLKGANFTGAQAGLQRCWTIGLVTNLWLISGLSGVVSGSTAYLVSVIFDSNMKNSITGTLSLILIAVFFVMTTRQGLSAGLSAVAIAVVVTITGALIANLVAGALGITAAVGSSIGVAISFALCVACAFFTVGAFSIPFVISVTGSGSIAVTVALISAIFSHKALAVGVGEPKAFYLAAAFSVAVATKLLGAYIGWRAIAGDKQHAWIQKIVIAFAATGGTSFRDADLTDADFTSALLKSTDFRNAILTRTCFYQAKKLSFVRSGTSYLSIKQLQQLLVSRQGQNRNFERQNLLLLAIYSSNVSPLCLYI